MEMISNLLPGSLADALGYAFMASLWQCTAIFVILWIILLFTDRNAAKSRYLIASLAMLTMLLVTTGTFLSTLGDNYQVKSFLPAAGYNQGIDLEAGAGNSGYINSGLQYFNGSLVALITGNYSLIALAWLTGILILSARFAGGLVYMRRIRNRSTKLLSPAWQKRVDLLKSRTGIKRAVSIFESSATTVPVVLGAFKPVILVPVGILAGIPYNQVEAIIAHELAHIKRNDFLVNLLQSVVEIILFYHPATWLISTIIRDERENCCDDIALQVCEDPMVYSRALISIQELALTAKAHSIAITGQKNKLLNRIKRVTKMEKRNSNITERLIAMAILAMIIMTSALVTGFTRAATEDKEVTTTPSLSINTPAYEQPAPEIYLQDTARIKTSTITTHFTDPSDKIQKRVRMEIKDGVVYEMYIDGVKVPENEIGNYQELIDKTIDDLVDAEADIQKAMKEVEDIDFEEIRAEAARAAAEIDQIDMEEMRNTIEESIKDSRLQLENAMVEMENHRIEIENALAEMENIYSDEFRKEFEEARSEMEKSIREMELYRSEMEHLHFDQFKREIEETLKELKRFNVDSLMKDIDFSFEMPDLPDIPDMHDRAYIQKSLEESHQEIQNALPPEKRSVTRKK